MAGKTKHIGVERGDHMPRFLWQIDHWPTLRWDDGALLSHLSRVRFAQGRLFGALETLGLGDDIRLEADALIEEAVKTSEIEGEKLSLDSVRSSVARRLGLEAGGLPAPERHVEGLVDLLLDASSRCGEPLTAERLKGWHAALFPTGYSGIRKITVADWRKKPMQVVSGPVGRERIHFEAPPPARVPEEMERFLAWWQTESRRLEGVVRAGVAHLWFETVHPFEDGNGRLGRALVDMALAQAEQNSRRFYSLSAQIHAERDDYYRALEEAQGGGGDITGWLVWFLGCVERAIGRAESQVQFALRKARFWRQINAHELNERQTKVVNRLLDAGPGGFEGGLTNRKYRQMTRASERTASRDIQDLVGRGIVVQNDSGGRSTRYELAWDSG
jgi:Fic family protein